MIVMLACRSNLRFWTFILVSTLGLLFAGTATSSATGQQLDPTETLADYQKILKANPQSSLAYYRIAELLFIQRNYQASANACRFALQGDGNPAWTKVWSHIQLGKIFDVTNQRYRAIKEYRLAVLTNDNTLGAVSEAEQLLQKPYQFPETR
jgi:tetratricopeptide (TPR) repeat protein